MSNALTEAIEERQRNSAARSWMIAAEAATPLASLRSALVAGHRGEAIAPRAFDDGLAAAAEMAAQGVAPLVRSPSASGWTAELADMPAFGGKKLGIVSPEGDRLEFFFDEHGALYLGGLTTTIDSAPVSIPFRRADMPGRGQIEIIANGLDPASSTASSFAGAPQIQTILGAAAEVAGLAADSVAALRKQTTSPTRRARPAAPPVPPAQPTQAERQEERFCRQCGKARRAGDRFCAYCGADFAASSTTAAAASESHDPGRRGDGNAPVCPTCGGATKPGWKFCRGCGARLS